MPDQFAEFTANLQSGMYCVICLATVDLVVELHSCSEFRFSYIVVLSLLLWKSSYCHYTGKDSVKTGKLVSAV